MGANTAGETCAVCGTEYEYNAKFPGKEICGARPCFLDWLGARKGEGDFVDVEARLPIKQAGVKFCDTVRQYDKTA